MFEWVHINRMPERDLKTFNASLNEELQSYTFFGYLFLAASVFFLIILIVVKVRLVFPYLAVVAVLLVGLYVRNIASSTYQKRLDCFLKGNLVSGVVSGHSRTFNPFSSTRKYAISLTTDDKKSITVEHTSAELWTKFPKNRQVYGLEYNGKYFFGPEMGVDFKLFLNQ